MAEFEGTFVNNQANGKIDFAGDTDWFKLSAKADTLYRIVLSEAAADALEAGILRLRNSKGQEIIDITELELDDGLYGIEFVNGAKAATYYVEVAGETTEDLGQYVLNVQTIEDDFGETTKGASTIGKSGLVSGAVQWAGDKDWLQLAAKADTLYRIVLSAGDGDTPLEAGALQLRDSKGQALEFTSIEDAGDGLVAIEFKTGPKAAKYYIEVAGEAEEDLGQYKLTVTALEDDFGDTTKTAGTIGKSGSESGKVQWADDTDWFKLSAKADTLYKIVLTPAAEEALEAGTLTLLDSKGVEITDVTELELDDGLYGIEFVNGAKAAAYYIAVAGEAAEDLGQYVLNVQAVEDDFGETTKGAGKIGKSGLVSGAVQWAGDKDWLQLAAKADTLYRIVLSAGDGDTPLEAGALQLLDSKGQALEFTSIEDAGDGLVAIEFKTGPKAAKYYIEVAGEAEKDLGQYKLTVTALEDDFGDTTKTAGTIGKSGSESGKVQWADDTDWFKLSAKADTLYQIVLTSAAEEALEAGTLTLLDSKGIEITDVTELELDDGLYGIEFVNSAKAGAYYIAVAGETAEDLGQYNLMVTAEPDDYTASTKTKGAFSTVSSTPVSLSGEIQWATDVDWIKLSASSSALYRFRLTAGEEDAVLSLRDAKGNLITEGVLSDDDDTDGTILAFLNPGKKTNVYLEITGINEEITDIAYTVTAELYLQDDYIGGDEVDVNGILNSLPDDFWT